jgi:hypothetical protein
VAVGAGAGIGVGAGGALVFTNPPDAATNTFWRIRSMP